MDLIRALEWRYAVKRFSDRRVPEDVLAGLIEATRLTPSAYGLQPYKVIVVESRSLREELLPFSYGQEKVLDCSHLVVLAADTNVGDDTVDRYIRKYVEVTASSTDDLAAYAAQMRASLAAMGEDERQQWAHQQAYIALGNLLTCAAVMGVDSCPMAGFDRLGYDQVLELPRQGLTSTVICALGYRHPDDSYASKPKVRFDMHEMALEL